MQRESTIELSSQLSVIESEEAEHLLSLYLLGVIKATIKDDKRYKSGRKLEMESYRDYPDSVSNNAKKGIELNEKGGNKCATQVGKIRAQQLAQKQPVSLGTIKRMYSYLSRAQEYYDEGDKESCGYIAISFGEVYQARDGLWCVGCVWLLSLIHISEPTRPY